VTLTQILIFAAMGLAAGRLYGRVSRSWLLFVASVLAFFWLQPALLVRNLPFVLPALTLGLAVIVWLLTRERGAKLDREDWLAAGALAGLMLLVAATRFVEPLSELLTVRAPGIDFVLILLIALAAIAAAAYAARGRNAALKVAVVLIIALLVMLKAEPLAAGAAAGLRSLTGQDPSLATSLDLGWLGFSYIAFRLIHVLRDRVAGRLPDVSLRDFVTYIVFFPALTAGPIERIERFAPQLQTEFVLGSEQLLAAGRRLFEGLFMKFVVADGLAFFALNAANAHQIDSAVWMWVALVAFAFRIHFDFAGYTSIAIGLGLLFGVLLPENFERPYRKQNLTAFWNSWHITLAQWFRAYYFNPFTRWLRTRNVPVWAVILLAQLSTMALIGLWHGITWNFLAWGVWHGAGLFVHNQWASAMKARKLPEGAWVRWSSTLLTFAFVALGWVWFALPQPEDANRVFAVLFGGGQ
jgi:alginate O-acetyltransferase complex protein AlgI